MPHKYPRKINVFNSDGTSRLFLLVQEDGSVTEHVDGDVIKCRLATQFHVDDWLLNEPVRFREVFDHHEAEPLDAEFNVKPPIDTKAFETLTHLNAELTIDLLKSKRAAEEHEETITALRLDKKHLEAENDRLRKFEIAVMNAYGFRRESEVAIGIMAAYTELVRGRKGTPYEKVKDERFVPALFEGWQS